ncbi:MAG TPA: nucleotidyltransferase domain-containing protein, partial [Candidatus Ozemobacteraceae bacterium]|nr:nucleotidyltransferase domain-containing protein [Candidatus Ozemobacteraceae bacterium]
MIDVSPAHLETIQRILSEHVPTCEVRAFGSRVTWTAKDYSDLDLAIVGTKRLDVGVMRRLKEAFEESDLPFRVDVIDWYAISDSFRKVIKKKCVVFEQSGKVTDDSSLSRNSKKLVDLLLTSKDGDWGKDSSAQGFVPFRVIRGTDFPRVRRGDLSSVPLRFLSEKTVCRRTLNSWDILIETAGGTKDQPTGRTLLIKPRTLEGFTTPVTCASL